MDRLSELPRQKLREIVAYYGESEASARQFRPQKQCNLLALVNYTIIFRILTESNPNCTTR